MRYSKDESTYILGQFNSGDTVTIDIYKLSDNSQVVNGGACSEIGTTGVFKYNFSQSITSKEEYLWIMTNGTLEVKGKIVLGGYMDDLDTSLETLIDVETGRWRIDTAAKQMIFYKPDNTTEIMRFNLYDANRNPAFQNVMERERV